MGRKRTRTFQLNSQAPVYKRPVAGSVPIAFSRKDARAAVFYLLHEDEGGDWVAFHVPPNVCVPNVVVYQRVNEALTVRTEDLEEVSCRLCSRTFQKRRRKAHDSSPGHERQALIKELETRGLTRVGYAVQKLLSEDLPPSVESHKTSNQGAELWAPGDYAVSLKEIIRLRESALDLSKVQITEKARRAAATYGSAEADQLITEFKAMETELRMHQEEMKKR